MKISTELSVDWTSREFQNQTILISRKIKEILHEAEFPLYARRFLSDIVATKLTRCKLEFKKCAGSKT